MTRGRVQLSRRRGWRMPAGAVKVSRPTRWGNPHVVGELLPADRAVELFEADLLAGRLPVSVDDVRRELAGKRLACWCRLDAPCHADVLAAIANAPGDR